MDEYAAIGVSGTVILSPDGWRVYFQGRLTAPTFVTRALALGYLAGMRGGSRKPEWSKE